MRYLLFLLSFAFWSCHNVPQVDRLTTLDFEHPSVLRNPECSFIVVKEKICGVWIGKKSVLSKDTTMGSYTLTIDYISNGSLNLLEITADKSRQTTLTGDLFILDENYVIKCDSLQIINIHYLSDKQLKLGEVLFKKMEGNG
ncbi:MAG: hypothetical protein V4580_16240 [Bacteroidota bacterium]